MSSFTHSGTTGDTFSSLAVVRCLGGGDYYLRMDNLDNITRSLGWGTAGIHSGRMRKIDYEFLAPIMKIQSCISSFEIWNNEPVDYELEKCAYHMQDDIWPRNFANWYAQAMKLDLEKYKRTLQIDPYVDVDKPTSIPGRPVCISRNKHHTDGITDLNNVEEWTNWFERGLADQCFFVGLPEEHAWFEETMKIKVHYEPTSDGLALARLIAGSKMMIGNQSMPATLALGIGTTLWVEVRKNTSLELNEMMYPFRSNVSYF